MGEDSQDAAGHPPRERVSVPQAADHLGTTVDAIRKRVQRGTIAHEKDPDGRVWILLDTGMTRHDEPGQRQDTRGELADELRDRIRYLERQVEEEREARRRADTLLAQLMQRIPELEPPAPPESPEPREPGPYRVRSERAEPVEPVDPTREEPERAQPERVEPERVEPERVEPERVQPQESPLTAADEQQGRGPVPDAGGPQEGTQRPW